MIKEEAMKRLANITEALHQLPTLIVILGSTLLLSAAGFSIAKLFNRLVGSTGDALEAAGFFGLAGFFLSILFLMQKKNANE